MIIIPLLGKSTKFDPRAMVLIQLLQVNGYLPLGRLGDHIQIIILPALVATAHNEEDGYADNDGYDDDNTADRDNDGQIS